MNLVWFILILAIFSPLGGEFMRYPFGSVSGIRLTDIIVGLVDGLFLIWKIGIEHQINWPKHFKFVVLFWTIGLLSLVFSGQLMGGIYLLRFIFYSFLPVVVYNLLIDRRINLGNVFGWLVSGTVGIAVLGFLQLVFFPSLEALTYFGYDPHQFRLVATFLDPNFAAAYLSVGLALSLHQFFIRKRRILLVVIGLILLAISLTFSRSGYLIAVSVIGLMFLRFWKKGLIFMIIILGLMFSLWGSFQTRIIGALMVDKSASERFDSWNRGLIAWSSNWVFGAGFDNLRTFFDQRNLFKTYLDNGGNSGGGVDSSLLFILATTGVFGFLSYFGFWVKSFKAKFWQDSLNYLVFTIMVSLLIGSQFVNSLFYPPIMLQEFILLGVLYYRNSRFYEE